MRSVSPCAGAMQMGYYQSRVVLPERRCPVSRMTENARAARTSSVSRTLRMVVINEKYRLLVKISQSRWWTVILGTLFPSVSQLPRIDGGRGFVQSLRSALHFQARFWVHKSNKRHFAFTESNAKVR